MPPPIVSVATVDGTTVDVTVVEATAPAVPAGATRVTPVSAEDIAAAQAAAAQAAAKAAVDAERRSLAAKRAAYTKRRNLSRPDYAAALEDPVIRGRLIALADPSVFAGDFLVYPKDSSLRDGAKTYVETFCSPLDAKLSAMVARNPSTARTALKTSLFNVRVKDQELRAAVAAQLGLKPENKAVDECIIRLVMQARAHGREWHDAKRRPLVGPSSSRWRKRLAGMREAAKAAEEPKVLHPRAAAQGFKVPALDRTAPTFPGITRTVKVWSSSPLGLRCETAEGKSVFVKRDEALDPTKQTVRFVVRKPGDAPNLLNSFRATVDDRELRSQLVAFSWHPCLDNGKVSPADWWWLLRRSMLTRFVGRMFDEVGARKVVGPEWSMVRKADAAPVVLPQVAALVMRLFPCDARPLGPHAPSSHVSTLMSLLGSDSRLAQPSGLAINESMTPERTLARLASNPEADECEGGVRCYDINAFLLRDSGSERVLGAAPATIQLTFAGYAEKFALDVAREAYQAEMLTKFRAARGLSVVVIDPSEHPAIAYRVFTYDESCNGGLWAVQPGNEGLLNHHRDLSFNVQWAAQSCMRHPQKAERSVGFYAHHTTAKFALVVDKGGKIHARALLWTDGIDPTAGVKLPPVLDRIYMASRRAFVTMADHAIDNGWIVAASVMGPLGVFPLFGLGTTSIRHGGAYLDTVGAFALADRFKGYLENSRYTMAGLFIGKDTVSMGVAFEEIRHAGEAFARSGLPAPGSLPSPEGAGGSGGDYTPKQHALYESDSLAPGDEDEVFQTDGTPLWAGCMVPPSATKAAKKSLASIVASTAVAKASEYSKAGSADPSREDDGGYHFPVFENGAWVVRKMTRGSLVDMAKEGGWMMGSRSSRCPVFYRKEDADKALIHCPYSKNTYLSNYLGADEGDPWNPASVRIGGKVAVTVPKGATRLTGTPSNEAFILLPGPAKAPHERVADYTAIRAKMRELASAE